MGCPCGSALGSPPLGMPYAPPGGEDCGGTDDDEEAILLSAFSAQQTVCECVSMSIDALDV